jgi:general secretion pathway protein D
MSNGLQIAFALLTLAYLDSAFGQQKALDNSDSISIPQQLPPAELKPSRASTYNFDSQTNLVSLLQDLRNLISSKNFERAEEIAKAALSGIQQTEQNKFYLNQIRKEETKIYYEQAKLAMSREEYSLASNLLEKYRENIARELAERKLQREVVLSKDGPKDASLVGKLVEELDKAKKDLSEIRAKSGLPDDDAKPDLERLMEEERAKVSSTSREAERLLVKARRDSAQGNYDQAIQQIDEALSILPANTATIALVSDLFQAKQQVIWYQMGEAMLKGKVPDVQKLVLEYKEIEESRRNAETETLGDGDEINFDEEMQKAQAKNIEQAVLAEEMLNEAKEEIKNKEYAKADGILYKIKNFLEPSTMTWPIILEASLIKNRIHLEKAEDAREIKDWNAAKKHLEEFKTGFYQDRDIQGDTLTFGRPGLKESRGEKSVVKELDLADKMAEKIRDDQRDPYRRDITEFTPDWKDRQFELEDNLMRAKVQFINGDLTGATETYRAIETRFSDNLEAKNMLKRISMVRQQESYLGYLKTRQEMLEEIEREWERPKVFDRQIEDVQEARNETSELEDKLSLIKIPEVPFFESPLDEAMQELMLKSKQFDLTEQDPAKKGVQIIVKQPPDDEPFPNVTITLNSMELGKMIQWITEMVSWTYDIRADAVVISQTGGSFRGRPLETEFYEVTQGTINRMTGGGGGGMGGGAADPFAPPPAGGGGGGADDTGLKIKAFLEGAGIPFDDGKGHKFVFDGFQMIVTHDRRSLDLIERILAKLDQDSSRQVEIETKFLEVQEGALDEISFDWAYNWGGANLLYDNSGNQVMDSAGIPVMSWNKGLTGNTRTLATAHSPTGVNRDTIISIPDNADASLSIANPVPRLPGKIGIGEGVSPLVDITSDNTTMSGGTSMIIGGSQAKLLISALKRKQGTDLLSAPRVTVMDGQLAQITVAQEFIYPTNYEPAPAPTAGGGGLGNQGGGGFGGAIQIQSATPSFEVVAPEDEEPGFREVGVVLEVTPTIEKYNSINLDLKPKVTEFDGFIEYGGSSAMIGTSQVGAPPMIIQPSGILMPIFSVRKVVTQVTIFDGATVIIGGLTREEVKTVNDKIPVLGNIPLIGRLFQSSAESYQKRNLLIFVTASIVSRGGSPVRENIQNISPQSIFKDPVILTPTGTIRRNFKEGDGIAE